MSFNALSLVEADNIVAKSMIYYFEDIFAASMEGVCVAAEVRCAYHIGKGHHDMARISSYKSLMIGKSTLGGRWFVHGWSS